MRSKKVTLTLALFGGSTGADRFYLGQNTAGWLTILLCWLVLPGAVYGIMRYNLYPNWEPFLLARYALPILFHVFATGRYLIMSEESFMSQNVKKSNTFPMVLLSFVITAILIVGSSRLLQTVQIVDIDKAEVEAVLSAEMMSQEFRNDEEAYRKEYDNKTLQIEGVVVETGNDFELGTYFALRGKDGDPFGIKCYFLGDHLKEAEQVVMGDKVTMKGIANGNKLENCTLLERNGEKVK
ncbi:MAG TPA: NINE protein [Chitinophagales bacterium]|nr:NINE protein [Chitinophagales bacterium]HNA56815.1 NINE protein [Chitinophagales bacterium]